MTTPPKVRRFHLTRGESPVGAARGPLAAAAGRAAPTPPVRVEVARSGTTAARAEQQVFLADQNEKLALLQSLLELGAKDVAVLRHDAGTGAMGLTDVRVPIEELDRGMRFVVRPGEKVATDGLILEAEWVPIEDAITRLEAVEWYDSGPLRAFLAGEVPTGSAFRYRISGRRGATERSVVEVIGPPDADR